MDLIECWPEHLDYPLHRKFLKEHRMKFDKVIIVFTKMNADTGDYREWVKQEMADDGITFLDNDPVAGDQDWRNVAVNKGLKESTANWVLFLEQDFIPREGFWLEVSRNIQMHYDAFGVNADGRLHPCCIFAKRSLIEKTSKNFGVVKDKSDHFGVFQSEISNYTHIDPETYYHMNGLSQNLYLLQKGQVPNFRPEEFKQYCADSILCGNIHPDFKELFKSYLNQ